MTLKGVPIRTTRDTHLRRVMEKEDGAGRVQPDARTKTRMVTISTIYLESASIACAVRLQCVSLTLHSRSLKVSMCVLALSWNMALKFRGEGGAGSSEGGYSTAAVP